ncbi:hypothetical protein DL96DRAFT_1600546 [Flagelloscypha sp. PMI_526]|nr:hypothetical protein DL96DRAFT_1600546 [Flagelloscypha sp. PMI_526]
MTAWNDATKYFRIVALAWFTYDWVLTFPAELRLYRRQSSWSRPSTACVLLILCRYLGLFALLFNFIGFFSHIFPEEGVSSACEVFYLFIPVTQCLASWASHAIFVVRTSAICQHAGRWRWVFISSAVVASVLEMFSQLYSFVGLWKVGSSGNCLIQFSDKRNVAWLYYAASTAFDFIIIVATYRGLQISHTSALSATRSSSGTTLNFNQVLWGSTIVYFAVTTFWNILNLVYYAIYNSSNATVLTAVAIAMTSMMSSRVILDMHEHVNRRQSTLPVNFDYSDSQSAFARSYPPQTTSTWVNRDVLKLP